ncbi:MAG: hypothetical protein QOE86_2599 [Solirubrobacteraceae bacterium]|nr:hypothetical protein [Solirubrobacteraceae bacterium]
MTALTVALGATDPVTRTLNETVLATLPARLAPTSGPDADVVVVSGLAPGWIDAAPAALRAGARGLLVARPATGDPGALRALAEHAAATGAAVAVETLVVDPAWSAVRPRLRASLPGASLLHGVAVLDGAPEAGRLEQIALVRSISGGLKTTAVASGGDESGYWISATVGGVPISLAGTAGGAGAPALAIDLLAETEHWKVRFDASAPAAPTQVTRFDADGGELWPAVYERAHRVVWRQLAAALLEGSAIPYGLGDLAADLALAQAL